MEGERVLLKENPLSLQTSLTPENFPHVPPLTKRKFVSLFKSGGVMGEVFCLSGRCGLVVECGFAHVLWVGCVGRAYAFHKCRLIPPHQSLTRQLPPKGKPSICCADMANMALHCGLPLQSALIRRLRRHLPPQRGRLPIVLLISKRVLQAFGTSDICI